MLKLSYGDFKITVTRVLKDNNGKDRQDVCEEGL